MNTGVILQRKKLEYCIGHATLLAPTSESSYGPQLITMPFDNNENSSRISKEHSRLEDTAI